jgi:N6-adenosine-specific RNA methylase IME4
MTPLDGIKAMTLPPLQDDAMLVLWRVAAMQREALSVAEAWGFEAKTELVWQKLTKHGKKHFGQGRYTRGSHETALICTRGRFRVRSHSIRSTFDARMPLDARGKIIHSAKPDEFYALIEELASGPYAELFARRRRRGWRQYGDELPPRVMRVRAPAIEFRAAR